MKTPTSSGKALASGVAGGVVATVTMDAAMVLAARLAPAAFASDKIGPEMIGRWAAGLAPRPVAARGHLRRTPVRGELWIGLAAHYFTGIIADAGLRRGRAGRGGRRPGVPGGDRLRVATGVLPLLLMYPSMGYGCCGRRSGDARRVVCTMLLGHVAFGAGIGALDGYQTKGMNCRRTCGGSPRSPCELGDQPGLFATPLGVQEHRRDAKRHEGQRRGQQRPPQHDQQGAAVHRMPHQPVDAVRRSSPSSTGLGKGVSCGPRPAPPATSRPTPASAETTAGRREPRARGGGPRRSGHPGRDGDHEQSPLDGDPAAAAAAERREPAGVVGGIEAAGACVDGAAGADAPAALMTPLR